MTINYLDKQSYPCGPITTYDNICKVAYYYAEGVNLYTIIIVKFLNQISLDKNDFFQENLKVDCSYSISLYKRNIIKREDAEACLHTGSVLLEDAKAIMEKLNNNDIDFISRLIGLSTLSKAEI